MTKQSIVELEMDLIELEAYRTLQSEDFDFGTGLIKYKGIYGSEDAYYEMDQQDVEDVLEDLNWMQNNYYLSEQDDLEVKTNKRNINLHNKRKYKKKLKCMADNYNGRYYYVILEKENIFGQSYLLMNHSRYGPGCKKRVRKNSNKKIRQYKKGISNSGGYRKVYDYTFETW